jgi:tetratricopeptide (TPR) repeat protein
LPVQALTKFEALYAASPTAANAGGILYSGMKSQRFSRVYKFAEDNQGPLGTILLWGQAQDLTQEEQSEIRKVRVDFLNAWLSAALKYQREYTVRRVSTLLRHEGIEPNRVPTIVGLAWIAHRKGDYATSLDLFSKVRQAAPRNSAAYKDALYGQALGLRATGQTGEAFALAEANRSHDPRMNTLHRDLILSNAYAAYEQGRYDESWALAQQAYANDTTSRQAKMLSAWSHYQLGEYDRAAALFKDLNDAQADKESADGLRASLSALEVSPDGTASEESNLATIASGEPASTPDVFSLETAERAFYRGHYLLAALDNPDSFSPLEETGFRWIGGGLKYQFRDGERGLGELTVLSEKIGMAWSSGLDHFKVEVQFANLDAGGAPSLLAPVGTWEPGDGPTAFNFTIEEDIIVPTLSWNREGSTEFDLKLGASAIGGEVSATLTGLFDVTFHHEAANFTLGVHRTAITESILSRSGALDPMTGTAFGGVVETGIHGGGYLPLNDRWNATGSASWGERTGENVADNSHVRASIGAGYNLELGNFSYFTVGPVYRFDSFEEDLSQFTFGHGGYYSPEKLHHIGAAVNFLTLEGKDWLVKGSVNAGYEKASQEGNVYYPLGPPIAPDVYAGSESSGLGISAWAQGAWRLNNRWILEGGAYANRNDDYSEGVAFLKLRYSFGDRTSLYRSDLTEDLYQPY